MVLSSSVFFLQDLLTGKVLLWRKVATVIFLLFSSGKWKKPVQILDVQLKTKNMAS